MSEGGILYTLYQLGYNMLEFFEWCFDYMLTPIPALGNISIIEIGFGTGLTLFFIKAILDEILGDILPGD